MPEIDLMLDCKFREEDEDCSTFHIIQFERNLYQVVHDGMVHNALGWDEMIGQIISITQPNGWHGYPMQTRAQVIAERAAREAKMKETNDE